MKKIVYNILFIDTGNNRAAQNTNKYTSGRGYRRSLQMRFERQAEI